MTKDEFDAVVQGVRYVTGGLAVVAAFLLVQSDVAFDPAVRVGLGAFLAFAAYVNPASVAKRLPGVEAPPSV